MYKLKNYFKEKLLYHLKNYREKIKGIDYDFWENLYSCDIEEVNFHV